MIPAGMREDQKPVAMSPWRPVSNPFHIRRLGKLQEELAELQKIVARCLIQGLDGADPKTGEKNLDELWREMADVRAQITKGIETFGLPRGLMSERQLRKQAQMDEWEQVLATEPDQVYEVRSTKYLAGEVRLQAVDGQQDGEVPQSLESGQLVRLVPVEATPNSIPTGGGHG